MSTDVQIERHGSAEAGDEHKAILIGTHRVCPPEETFKRVQPFLPHIGITRVSDVTQLDCIGIPVFQAIRPGSLTLSLSQGKGFTKMLAKVSAIMESIETWHSENPALSSITLEAGEMAPHLPYSIYDLNVVEDHLLHDGLPLAWCAASILGTQEQTFVPLDYVHLDFRPSREWLLPTFQRTSNGLASGNSREEAILHGLYEVIERDIVMQGTARITPIIPVEPGTVDGIASFSLIERLRQAGVSFEISYLEGPAGLACFSATIISRDYPILCGGHGCHLDRDVALSRALTEAAQTRLTYISGARDDINLRAYAKVKKRGRPLAFRASSHPFMDFRDIPTWHFPTLQADLQEVTRRVLSIVDCPPLVVDLTRQEFDIPVVFVVVPKLHCEKRFI